ncbi:type II and III secretion system protein [Pseudomonas sp. S07E 245]|nr:type II and III secretion system protein [Pseudomonas sp. S07E 245]
MPPINTTSLASRVLSGFGRNVALGGVYSDTDSTVVRSVPFLDRSGLKWLISSTPTVMPETELVSLLTPRLVGTPI